MGVKSVHPLDGANQNWSIKCRKSILSIPVAPALHQKITTNPSGLAARLQINTRYPPTLFSQKFNAIFVNCEQLTLNQMGSCPYCPQVSFLSIVSILSTPFAPENQSTIQERRLDLNKRTPFGLHQYQMGILKILTMDLFFNSILRAYIALSARLLRNSERSNLTSTKILNNYRGFF